jgi:hypothetical protein
MNIVYSLAFLRGRKKIVGAILSIHWPFSLLEHENEYFNET